MPGTDFDFEGGKVAGVKDGQNLSVDEGDDMDELFGNTNNEIATSGNPEQGITLEDVQKAKEILTDGKDAKPDMIASRNPIEGQGPRNKSKFKQYQLRSDNPKPERQGITPEIKAEAIRLAESPKGLDIAEFQKKHNIHIMNVDELLRG